MENLYQDYDVDNPGKQEENLAEMMPDAREDEKGEREIREDDTKAEAEFLHLENYETHADGMESAGTGNGENSAAEIQGNAEEAQADEDLIKKAQEKLKREMEDAKDELFADPVISYLLERCREDRGLAEDVMQPNKTWDKCLDYIYSQAKKKSSKDRFAVSDDVVYEWAEDYYHLDDKAAEAAKEEKTKVTKAKTASKASLPKKDGKTDQGSRKKVKPGKPDAKNEREKKPEIKNPVEKTRKNNKELEGQMDMFSMLGM